VQHALALQLLIPLLPQAVKPGAQDVLHAPFEQVPPRPQSALHEPQARGLLARSRQAPAQLVFGEAHVETHPVDKHCSPEEHAMLHAAHVDGLMRSASHPFVGSPSQSARPGAHSEYAHAPALQIGKALATWHGVPAPQPYPGSSVLAHPGAPSTANIPCAHDVGMGLQKSEPSRRLAEAS